MDAFETIKVGDHFSLLRVEDDQLVRSRPELQIPSDKPFAMILL